MAADIKNDPKFKDFVNRAQSIFGLDPNQQIDVNDPMTKLTMTIILTTLEQGRDNYSYDQYIKGIARSIGLDPAEFDKEINKTSLGFENNSGSVGFVSPATSTVVSGGSTIPRSSSSGYVNVGLSISLPSATNIISGGGAGFGFGDIFSGTSTGQLSGSSAAGGPSGGFVAPTSSGTATPFTGDRATYYNTMYNKIYDAAVVANVPNPEVIAQLGAAQTTVETGGGKHMVGNNAFGIKGVGDLGQVTANTNEVLNGQTVRLPQNFAAYSSLDASAAGYVAFLQKNPRYANVLKADNIGDAVTAIGKSGYATDPNYAQAVYNAAQKGAATITPRETPTDNINPSTPTTPANFSGPNTTTTQNADGSTTYKRTNEDGSVTTVVQSKDGKLTDGNGVSVSAETSITTPGWSSSSTTTVTNTDSNGKTVSYTVTNNDTGQKIVYTPGVDGKDPTIVDAKTGRSISTSEFNTNIAASDLASPSAQKLTADTVPDNATAGVPDSWVKETNITGGADGTPQTVSVKYIDPNNSNNFKQIDSDGVISNSGGATGQNYFNGASSITTPPPSSAAGVDGWNTQVSYNDNGVLTTVKYTNPQDPTDYRILTTSNNQVKDSNGTTLGTISSRTETSTTSYSYQSNNPITSSSTDLQQAQPSVADASRPLSVSSIASTNNATPDPTIIDLRDRKSEIATTLALNNVRQNDLVNEIKTINSQLDDPNSTLTFDQKEQLLDKFETLHNDYQGIKKQQEVLVSESQIIDQKLSNPASTVVNAEEQAKLQNITDQQLQDVKDKVSNNNAVLQDLYQEKENINNEIAFYDKQIREGKMSEAAAAEPKAVLEERLINTGASIGITSDKGKELLSQQREIQAQVEQNNTTLELAKTPADPTQAGINQYSFAQNTNLSQPNITTSMISGPATAVDPQAKISELKDVSNQALSTSDRAGALLEKGYADGSITPGSPQEIKLLEIQNSALQTAVDAETQIKMIEYGKGDTPLQTDESANSVTNNFESTNTLDTTGQPLYQSNLATDAPPNMYNTPMVESTPLTGGNDTPNTEIRTVNEFQTPNSPGEFATVDTMPSGGRGEGNTVLESPGERAAYQAENAPAEGGSSAGGSSSPASAGSAAAAAKSQAGGGGC